MKVYDPHHNSTSFAHTTPHSTSAAGLLTSIVAKTYAYAALQPFETPRACKLGQKPDTLPFFNPSTPRWVDKVQRGACYTSGLLRIRAVMSAFCQDPISLRTNLFVSWSLQPISAHLHKVEPWRMNDLPQEAHAPR